MRVFIQNGDSQVPVECRTNDRVAMLKANYLNMPGFKGDPNFITFEWEGQMMDDSRMLKDYGVRPESVIFHVDNKMGGTFAPMNYAKMAREFRGRSMESGYRGRSASRGGSMGRRARSLGDEYPRRSRSMGYGNQWQSNGYNRNSRFGGYHGYGGSYEDASSTSIARRAPGFGFAPEYRRPAYDWSYSHSGMPTRAIRQMNTMEVGRFNFRLMHRFEGRWQGEAIMMSSRSDMMSEPYRGPRRSSSTRPRAGGTSARRCRAEKAWARPTT
jgi:hypothetical protein